jgi:hypothetical protein
MNTKKRIGLKTETLRLLTDEHLETSVGGITYPPTNDSRRTCELPCWPKPPPFAPED